MGTSSDGAGLGELPSYFDDPTPATGAVGSRHWQLPLRVPAWHGGSSPGVVPAGRSSASASGRERVASPSFACMVRLPGVATAIDNLWPDSAVKAEVVVCRRLKLGPPKGDADSGWAVEGRMRRLFGVHWVPMVVEVWPTYGDYVRMTMTPKVRVLARWRYFSSGNLLFEKLYGRMADASESADTDLGPGGLRGSFKRNETGI